MVSEIVGVQNRNSTDRRQMTLPIEFDRRSGVDRRAIANEHAKNTSVFRALEVLPPVRRVSSLPDKLNAGDTTSALGLASLALINLPEDLRDIGGAIKQIKGANPLYDYKEYQHDFSFFRGTAIEEWLHKHIDAGKKWAQWLYDNDKNLADTKFGIKVMDKIKATDSETILTPIKGYADTPVYAFSYKGSGFAKLTARTLHRTTLLGVGALALLEVPKIVKSLQKGNSLLQKSGAVTEQTAKSAINVASITAGIGYAGTIGAKYGGAAGSLIGMGIGAILGSKLSGEAQRII